MREAKEWDFPKIDESEISNSVDIHQFSLGFDDMKISAQCAASLNEKFSDVVHAYPNAKSVDTTPASFS